MYHGKGVTFNEKEAEILKNCIVKKSEADRISADDLTDKKSK